MALAVECESDRAPMAGRRARRTFAASTSKENTMLPRTANRIVILLAALTAIFFAASWLVVATVGNQDSGWKGILGDIACFGFLLAAAALVVAAVVTAARRIAQRRRQGAITSR
jgi:hypothetical protein